MRLRLALAFLGIAVALFAFGRPASTTAASISNGGFETGTFAGWNVFDQPGGSGSWFVYSGTVSPLSGFTIPAPPQGVFAATSDQGGPGAHVLYRDIALEPGMSHSLSFFIYYMNDAGTFFTPATLDYTTIPNQQYRVDLMNPAAGIQSVNPVDILMPLFRSQQGGIPGGQPGVLNPIKINFDISAFAGQTVRLRFAETDNQFFFQAGVDAVSVDGSTTFGTSAGFIRAATALPPTTHPTYKK